MGERDSATSAYIKYMLQEFVVSYEEYRESKIDRNQQFVIQNAVENISTEYLLANDKSNPDAPIVKYGKQATEFIYVDPNTINFAKKIKETMKEGERDGQATLIFVSALAFSDSTRRDNNFEANIKFKYKELIVDQVTHEIKQLPQIIITDYKTKPI
jgi:type IV secretory pathway component VirB8